MSSMPTRMRKRALQSLGYRRIFDEDNNPLHIEDADGNHRGHIWTQA